MKQEKPLTVAKLIPESTIPVVLKMNGFALVLLGFARIQANYFSFACGVLAILLSAWSIKRLFDTFKGSTPDNDFSLLMDTNQRNNKNFKPFLIGLFLFVIALNGLPLLVAPTARLPIFIVFCWVAGVSLVLLGSSIRFRRHCVAIQHLTYFDGKKGLSRSPEELNKMIEIALRVGECRKADTLSKILLRKAEAAEDAVK